MDRDKFMEEYETLMKDLKIRPEDNFEEKIKPILDLVKSNTPNSLYRFRSFNEYNLDGFIRDFIYHSVPSKFNDPHDSLMYINHEELKKAANAQLSISHQIDLLKYYKDIGFFTDIQEADLSETKLEHLRNFAINEIDRVGNIVRDNGRSSRKISCFSEDIESTLMWAHYTNYHKGFALEYSSDLKYNEVILLPIIYTSYRYDGTELCRDVIEYSLLEQLGIDDLYISDLFSFIKTNLYKSLDWKYEKEWRCILKDNSNSVIIKKPTAIYLGTSMQEDHKEILKWYANQKNIEIYQMIVDENVLEYKLTPKKIS